MLNSPANILHDSLQHLVMQIRKLLVKSPSKSCELDPMPTYLLKQCVNNILPVITAMVNKSLNEMPVPTAFKQAIVRPLLKKPWIGYEQP